MEDDPEDYLRVIMTVGTAPAANCRGTPAPSFLGKLSFDDARKVKLAKQVRDLS